MNKYWSRSIGEEYLIIILNYILKKLRKENISIHRYIRNNTLHIL